MTNFRKSKFVRLRGRDLLLIFAVAVLVYFVCYAAGSMTFIFLHCRCIA